MTGRRNRVKRNLDYKKFHETGEKVYKVAEMANPDLEGKKIKELQISEDIVEVFDSYDLNDLDTIDEITDGTRRTEKCHGRRLP